MEAITLSQRALVRAFLFTKNGALGRFRVRNVGEELVSFFVTLHAAHALGLGQVFLGLVENFLNVACGRFLNVLHALSVAFSFGFKLFLVLIANLVGDLLFRGRGDQGHFVG